MRGISGKFKRPLNAITRITGRFARDKDGTTAVEFGLLGLPFFAMIAVILETSLVLLASNIFDSALQDTTRQIRTGQAKTASHTIADFRAGMCDRLVGLFDCDAIVIVVREVSSFERTGNRRDFAIPPPEPTLLDRLKDAGRQVYAIGKISDIYAGHGITHKIKASGNMTLFDKTLEAMEMTHDGGLIFTNFVDFDQDFGHRRDVPGYANALEQFDRRLPELIAKMRDDDLLVITADHGNDPSWTGTDHTREQVPVLCYAPSLKGRAIGLRPTFADIGQSIGQWLGVELGPHGTSFL